MMKAGRDAYELRQQAPTAKLTGIINNIQTRHPDHVLQNMLSSPEMETDDFIILSDSSNPDTSRDAPADPTNANTERIIPSGRAFTPLEGYLDFLTLNMSAEHGVFPAPRV